MSEREELRALIREVIRDLVPQGGPVTETVNLSTDAQLAAFVHRILDLSPAEADDLRAGRKQFRLAAPARVPAPAPVPAAAPAGVRRIEKGAVTEAMIRRAARAGERLVLGPAAVLTPLARDRARSSGVPIEKER